MSACGALLALPVSIAAFAVTGNFWISITCLSLKYLLGENWLSPSITMIQNTTEPNKQASTLAALYFYLTIAGTLSTVVVGQLA